MAESDTPRAPSLPCAVTYRRLAASDAPFLRKLMTMPAWIANIGDRGIRSDADALAYWREKIAPACTTRALGNYAICCDGLAVGTIGIYARPGLEQPDLGFALLPDYRRRGLAEAAARWSIGLAREESIPRLSAIVLPANEPSRRLLAKLGFRCADLIRLREDADELERWELVVDERFHDERRTT